MKSVVIVLFTVAVFINKTVAEEPKNLNRNELISRKLLVLACGIVNLTASFIFKEIPENSLQANSIIEIWPTFNVDSISLLNPISFSYDEENELNELNDSPKNVQAADFIGVEFLEASQTIQFVLNRSLSDYRKLMWDPVIETTFTFNCRNNLTYNMTYLLVVEDENLETPYFEYSEYKIYVPGEDIKSELICLNKRVPIVVTDLDYNEAYANLTVECVGNSDVCKRTQLSLTKKSGSSIKGNRYEMHMNLEKKEGEIDTELKFKIRVSDGVNGNETDIVVKIGADGESERNFPILQIGLGAGAVIALLVGGVGFMGYKKRKVENTLRKLTEVEIREFEQGTANISTAGKRSVTVDVNAPIMSLPYQRQFDIPRENLRIDETSILGTGAFGIVMKGTVYHGKDSITVAVKTVKRNVGVLYFKALLSELKIMAYIDKHNNVVSLIGACTHNIRKRELYIAVEYCANGNFQSYLKHRKDSFDNFVVDGILTCTQNPGINGMKHTFNKTISTFDLLRWSYQIANGMEFLKSKNVIHGDLAARNILLDDQRVAKIADFGLSRRIVDYHSNYYHTKTSSTTPLPWKWMAPESLKYMTFSHKSDIWSFGVVLWETFTLAQTPYPGLQWSENFVDRLMNGLRMTKPEFATDSIYDMIVDCWNTDPGDRPVIDDLKRLLESMINSVLQQQGYGYMRVLGNQPYISMMNDNNENMLPDRYEIPIYC